jgi:hypothetical protein
MKYIFSVFAGFAWTIVTVHPTLAIGAAVVLTLATLDGIVNDK